MNIECTKALDGDIIEKMDIAKKDCLLMESIPYSGVKYQMESENKAITIYNLLPGLEEVQIIVKTTPEDSIVYLVRSNIVASITEKSLEELLSNITLITTCLEKGEFSLIPELLILPKEIEDVYHTMDNLTINANKNETDLLYQKYALLLKKIRAIQLQNIKSQIYQEKISR